MANDARSIIQLDYTMSAMRSHHQTCVHGLLRRGDQGLCSLGLGVCALIKLAHAACVLSANWQEDANSKTSHTKDRA